MKLVSIVIPTYNRSNSIELAIKSALNQTYVHKEILVIDDGSTDDTKAVLEAYRSQVKYIYQENKGVSAARNTGINNASGEWIAFLDSDDEWNPNKLEIQMAFIDSHPHIVAHVTNAIFIGKNYSFNYFDERRFLEKNLEDSIIKRPLIACFTNWFLVPTCMVKKSVLDQAGLFNEKMAIFEDGDFFTRVSLCGEWGVSFEPLLIAYRRDDDAVANLSAVNKKNKSITISNQIMNAYSLLDNSQINGEEKRFLGKRLAALLYDKAVIEKENGNAINAIGVWKKSLRHDFSMKSLVKGALLILPYKVNNALRSSYRKLARNDSNVMRSSDD
ncbi:MAG: glycosyltransferase family 2 protein [Spirochaetes bacterium]|nr:glycosyltransferase family 2 protein [Spirochaetota bacterium]